MPTCLHPVALPLLLPPCCFLPLLAPSCFFLLLYAVPSCFSVSVLCSFPLIWSALFLSSARSFPLPCFSVLLLCFPLFSFCGLLLCSSVLLLCSSAVFFALLLRSPSPFLCLPCSPSAPSLLTVCFLFFSLCSVALVGLYIPDVRDRQVLPLKGGNLGGPLATGRERKKTTSPRVAPHHHLQLRDAATLTPFRCVGGAIQA